MGQNIVRYVSDRRPMFKIYKGPKILTTIAPDSAVNK